MSPTLTGVRLDYISLVPSVGAVLDGHPVAAQLTRRRKLVVVAAVSTGTTCAPGRRSKGLRRESRRHGSRPAVVREHTASWLHRDARFVACDAVRVSWLRQIVDELLVEVVRVAVWRRSTSRNVQSQGDACAGSVVASHVDPVSHLVYHHGTLVESLPDARQPECHVVSAFSVIGGA